MREYHIEISQTARRDITRNTDYIAFDKQSPETAMVLARGFRKAIHSLDVNPQRHEFDEENGIVNIVRVLHMLVDSKAVLLRTVKK